jgi:LysM repeat protein
MRKFLFGFITLAWIFFLAVEALPTAAQAGDAWALIAEVNAYRAANGLPPFEVDGSLMAAAQGHSEYMANTGNITHSGPGGSSARDRAVAVGYGGGAAVQVIENIAGGHNLSTSRTVYSMWQDDLHRQTMLTPYYVHIGAGVANAGSFVYYTIDVGRVQGAPPPATATRDPAATLAPSNTLAPTKVAALPVVVASPKPDGSIVHIVEPGQALYTIAVIYEVPLDELLVINGLNMSSVIYPGDEIIIKPGPTSTNTQPSSPTHTRRPGKTASATQEKTSGFLSPLSSEKPPTTTSIPTVQVTAIAGTPQELSMMQPAETTAVGISDSASPLSSNTPDEDGMNLVFFVIFFFVLIGVAMVVFGGFLRRNPERDSRSDPPMES